MLSSSTSLSTNHRATSGVAAKVLHRALAATSAHARSRVTGLSFRPSSCTCPSSVRRSMVPAVGRFQRPPRLHHNLKQCRRLLPTSLAWAPTRRAVALRPTRPTGARRPPPRLSRPGFASAPPRASSARRQQPPALPAAQPHQRAGGPRRSSEPAAPRAVSGTSLPRTRARAAVARPRLAAPEASSRLWVAGL